MNILDVLDQFGTLPRIIAFVGAGGKTTAMFFLAQELRKRGKNVLVTTSTKIYLPASTQYDSLYVDESIEQIMRHRFKGNGEILVAAANKNSKTNKLIGFQREQLNTLCEYMDIDHLLFEADGAAGKSIKAPADHEPVLSESTDLVLGVIGFDVLGKKINAETTHRSELLTHLTGAKIGTIIDHAVIEKLVESPMGLFKSAPESCLKILLLNKIDTLEHLKTARRIVSKPLPNLRIPDGIILSCMIRDKPVLEYFGLNGQAQGTAPTHQEC